MSYQSPIDIITRELTTTAENGVYKAVLEQGITIDKDELIQALSYDRDQYNKGYEDGRRDALDKLSTMINYFRENEQT